jgi:CRISPR-associated protein Cas2
MLWLVAYDITDAKRLARVAKLMKRYGTRVQRSIFECRLDQTRLSLLRAEIKATIKPRRDRVQMYRLCDFCQQRFAEYQQGALTIDEELYLC